MRNDCTVVMLSERNEADDEEAIRRRNRSCVSGVGVAQPRSESELSRKWVVPLQACVYVDTIIFCHPSFVMTEGVPDRRKG